MLCSENGVAQQRQNGGQGLGKMMIPGSSTAMREARLSLSLSLSRLAWKEGMLAVDVKGERERSRENKTTCIVSNRHERARRRFRPHLEARLGESQRTRRRLRGSVGLGHHHAMQSFSS